MEKQNYVPCWTQEDRPLPSKTANLAGEGKRNLVDGRCAALRPYRLALWPLLLMLGLSTVAWGQNLHLDHWDKALYFKIRDNVQPTYEAQLRPAAGGAQMYSAFDALLGQYGMTRLYRPFAMLGTPLLERVYRVEFADSLGGDSLLVRLERLPNIEWASLIPIARMDAYVPNDEGGCSSGQDALRLIRAFDAFSLHQGGNASVAIVDDAVVTSHTDLAANLLPGYEAATGVTGVGVTNPPFNIRYGNFDHGTHVAGIAGAVTDNGYGLASIGFMNKIVPVKVRSDLEFWGYYDYAIEGLAWAVANATSVTPNIKVVNCSWGFEARLAGPGLYATLMDIARTAASNDILIVASAGNQDHSWEKFPAALGEYQPSSVTTTFVRDPNLVLAVSNVDFQNKKSALSNHGTWVDVAAYGENIVGLGYNSNFPSYTSTYMSGASMSAPLVAGLAGLIYSYAPNITRNQVIDALKLGSNPSLYNLPDNQAYAANMSLGSGIIDALGSLNMAAQLTTVPDCYNPITRVDVSGPLDLQGQSAQYSVSVTYPNLSLTFYTWGDGSTLPDFTFYPVSTGENEIVVTVTSQTGCTAVGNLCVNVTCPITPTLSISPRSYVQLGQGVTVTNTTNSPGATYSWHSSASGATLGTSTATEFPLTATDSGIYYVTLVATHSLGCTVQEVATLFLGGCTNPLRVATWPMIADQRLSFTTGRGVYSASATPANPAFRSTFNEAGGLFCDDDGAIKLTSNGNFLFYYPPNGGSVQSIPLNGNNSASQNSIIVQRPDGPNPAQNNRYYYVFTNNAGEGPANGFNVHVWDGQNPAQVVSSQLFSTRATEHLTAVRHCNGKDIWILSHEFGNNTFHAYLVTGSSPVSGTISFQDVTSNAGPSLNLRTVITTYGPQALNIEAVGTLKPNLGGDKLAMTVNVSENTLNSPNGGLHLFSFDNSTGTISNARHVLNNTNFYGTEFSPDGGFVYVSRIYDSRNGIYTGEALLQYEMSTGISSTYNYTTNGEGQGHLQLGMDGKIYYTESNQARIGIFNQPNQSANGANFRAHGINTAFGLSQGLPNVFNDYFAFAGNPINVPQPICAGSTGTVTAQYACNGTHLWSVASSAANGANIVGSNQNGSCVINFGDPGEVTITLVKTSPCGGPFTYTRVVTVNEPPLPPPTSMIPPTCSNPVRLDAGPGYFSYDWGSGQNTRYLFVTTTNVYVCTFTNTAGCSNTVAFPVTITGPVVSVTLNVLSSCLTPSAVTLTASVNPSNPNYTYSWFDPSGILLGTTTNNTFVANYVLGEFRVEVFANSCTNTGYSDFQGAAWPIAEIYPIPPVCINTPFVLTARSQPNLSYSWSGPGISPPNNSGNTLNVTNGVQEPGTFVLTVRNALGCTTTASVRVDVVPAINAPNPTTLTVCTFPYTLDAGVNVHSYLWSNNSTGRYTTISAPGTYTCMLENTLGCRAMVSILVNGAGNVSLTHNAPRCYVGTRPGVTITAQPACSDCTYSFSGPLLNSTSNINSRNVTFTGTYRVTMTSSGGCSSTASVTIPTMTQVPQVTLATSNQSPCPGEIITLSNPLGTSGTYTWSGGGINSSGTAPSITTTFPIPGQPVTYAYTLTLGGGVCTATASVQVTPSNDCCTVSPTQYVLRNTSMSMGGALVSGRAYTVIGTYKMDRTSSLSNVTFIMGPDASIEIGSPNGANPIDVNLNNCRFQACDKIWYGISVGNRTTLSMATCLVTGSLNGLMLGLQQTSAYTMPATIKISDGLFENNVRGICTPRTNAANAMSGWFEIVNTRFVASASTMPNPIPTIVQPNRAYTRTITAGIDLYQLTSQGGFNLTSGSGVNSFTGPMLTGVNLSGMISLISNATFNGPVTGIRMFQGASTNIKNVTVNNSKCGIQGVGTTFSVATSRFTDCGAGVRAENSFATVLGAGSSAAVPNFNRCQIGIQCVGTSNRTSGLVARDNNIVANMGISLNGCRTLANSTATNVSITNNNIMATNVAYPTTFTTPIVPTGIGLANNEPYGGFINANYINVVGMTGPSPQGTGIAISVVPTNRASNVRAVSVTNNVVDMPVAAANGISGTNIKGYHIFANTVNMQQPQLCKSGIVLSNATGNTLGCNTIAGANSLASTTMNTTPTKPYFPAALLVESGSNNRLQCNVLDRVNTGILYSGAATDAGNTIVANNMNRHNTALYFGPSQILGEQRDRGNSFGVSATLRNENVTPTAFGNMHGRIITNSVFAPTTLRVLIPNNFFRTDWIDNNGSISSQASCNNNNPNRYCPLATSQCSNCTGTDGLIAAANGQPMASEYNDAVVWWAKKNAYEQLLENDSLLWQNALLQNFQDSMSNTEVADLYEVEQSAANAGASAASSSTQMEGESEQIQVLNALLMELNDQLAAASNGQDSLMWTDSLRMVIAELELRKTNYDLALAAYKSAIDGDLANTKLDNDALVTLGVFESLQKDMNNIWLEYLQSESGEMDSVQYETVLYWAEQCPFQYGPGVYMARALVATRNHLSYNDVLACQQVGMQFRQGHERPEVVNGYHLVPNPSNGYQLFSCDEPLRETSRLTYYDIAGRPQRTYMIPKGSSMLDVELELSNGVYYVKLQNSKEDIHLGKIVLIKD